MIKYKDPTAPSGFGFELTQSEMAQGKTCAFMTGPMGGVCGLADGTVYDLTDDHIAIRPEHEKELKWRIHKMHHAIGNFLDSPLPPDPTGE